MKIKRFENIVEHAASGLRMPEALARRIEQLSRGLPADFTYRRIARQSDSLSLDAGERTDVSVITTDAVDREGECVLPGGGDWSGYNRVVTFAHRYDQLPVGSNWWIRAVRQAQRGLARQAHGRSLQQDHGGMVRDTHSGAILNARDGSSRQADGESVRHVRGLAGAAASELPEQAQRSATAGSLVAKTHYPQKPADWGDAPWLPSAVLHLMQQPVPTCTGKSIGFLPLNVRSATANEAAERPELRGVPIIDRWVGVEYAVVPVPCNPEAEMQAVAKGMQLGVIDAGLRDLIAESAMPFASLTRRMAPHGKPNREEIRRLVLTQMREALHRARGSVG